VHAILYIDNEKVSAVNKSLGIENYAKLLWHGTSAKCSYNKLCGDRRCNICSIISNGMRVECCREEGLSYQRFGRGIYFTGNSARAHEYNAGSEIGSIRAVILSEVSTGRFMGHILEGQTPIEALGAAGIPNNQYDTSYSVEGHTNDVRIVYANELVVPKYILYYSYGGVAPSPPSKLTLLPTYNLPTQTHWGTFATHCHYLYGYWCKIHHTYHGCVHGCDSLGHWSCCGDRSADTEDCNVTFCCASGEYK